ncbi:PIN domain-containing protein [Cryobacterium sp. RTS3]|nr:PIN domain-containing protein [Cryobacterium sp. RTS3]MEB0267587.1 PIN domain-containing protein [Cryobacterium sp. 10I5]
MFTALLDSCVLWPSTLRDFLLSLAIEQAYTPAWSSAVLDEVERNEAVKLIERGPELSDGEAAQRAHRRRRGHRRGSGWSSNGSPQRPHWRGRPTSPQPSARLRTGAARAHRAWR